MGFSWSTERDECQKKSVSICSTLMCFFARFTPLIMLENCKLSLGINTKKNGDKALKGYQYPIKELEFK